VVPTARSDLAWPALGALAAAVFVVIATEVDQLAFRQAWVPVRPVFGSLLLLLAVSLVVVVLRGGPSPRRLAPLVAAGLPFVAGFALLAAGTAVAGLLAPAGVAASLRRVALYGIDTLTLAAGMGLALLPASVRWLRRASAAALLLLAGTVAVDVLAPGTFSLIASRPAGTTQQPNAAAFLLVVLATLSWPWRGRRSAGAWALLAVATVAALCTLSRAGFLLLGVLLLSLALGAPRPERRRAFATLAIAWAGVVLAVLWLVSIAPVGDTARAQDRLATFTQPWQLLDDHEERSDLLLAYLRELERSPLTPWLGLGGEVDELPRGPHNRYLYEWLSAGLLGLAGVVLLLASGALLAWRAGDPRGLVLVALVAVYSGFAHTLLDQRAMLLAFGWTMGLCARRAHRPAPRDA
jgi:hypothetical protein